MTVNTVKLSTYALDYYILMSMRDIIELVNQSINQSINLSINKSINQSINLSINQAINQSINQFVNHSIDQSINISINQSINQSIMHAGSRPAQSTNWRHQLDDRRLVDVGRWIGRYHHRCQHLPRVLHRDVPDHVGRCKSWFSRNRDIKSIAKTAQDRFEPWYVCMLSVLLFLDLCSTKTIWNSKRTTQWQVYRAQKLSRRLCV